MSPTWKSRSVGYLLAAVLSAATLPWAGLSFVGLVFRVRRYCEDAGSCVNAAPVWAVSQALVATVGIGFALTAAARAIRHGGKDPAQWRVGRPLLWATVALAVWLVLLALRPR